MTRGYFHRHKLPEKLSEIYNLYKMKVHCCILSLFTLTSASGEYLMSDFFCLFSDSFAIFEILTVF